MRAKVTTDLILEHWKHGKSELDWRGLSIKEKREWLKACLFWTGLPNAQIKSFDYIIDATQVSDKFDFYCLLGEAFFGYRGYFGQDSQGFKDCFSEIYVQQKSNIVVEKGAKVIINDSKNLQLILSEEYSYIIEIFPDMGFEVEYS